MDRILSLCKYVTEADFVCLRAMAPGGKSMDRANTGNEASVTAKKSGALSMKDKKLRHGEFFKVICEEHPW